MKAMLTDRALKAMKPAAPGTRKMLWDSAVPSFGARVSEHGKITFIVLRRRPGDKHALRRMLGQYPIMPLAEAREAALLALREIERGIDPKKRKEAERCAEAQRRANSFASAAEDFIVRHVRKLRSGAEVESAIRRELVARWGERPITDISRRDIIALIEEIADTGRNAVARKIHAYCSKLFGWAVARGKYGLETSPCADVKPAALIGAPEARQRVLSDSEMLAVWRASEGLSYPVAPFMRLLLLTGQRLREVAEMQWSEIDFDKALWTIPAGRMKADSAHVVPLSQDVVAIIESLPRWTGSFVFSTTGGARPISGFSKIKLRIDAALAEAIPAWRFHDLRRTMRTGLSALRVPDTVSELCIAHTQKGLHKIYDQHTYLDEKRHAFDAWANHVLAICEPGGQGNVVPIAARG
jgi:integrase